VPAVAVATAVSAMKFDSPWLTCYSALTHAEMLGEMVTKESVAAATDRALSTFDKEVAAVLASCDWRTMAQDQYDQAMEMRCEVLTRLARYGTTSLFPFPPHAAL
jgi:hypothetical protein